MTAYHPFVYPALTGSRHVEADFPRLALKAIQQAVSECCRLPAPLNLTSKTIPPLSLQNSITETKRKYYG